MGATAKRRIMTRTDARARDLLDRAALETIDQGVRRVDDDDSKERSLQAAVKDVVPLVNCVLVLACACWLWVIGRDLR